VEGKSDAGRNIRRPALPSGVGTRVVVSCSDCGWTKEVRRAMERLVDCTIPEDDDDDDNGDKRNDDGDNCDVKEVGAGTGLGLREGRTTTLVRVLRKKTETKPAYPRSGRCRHCGRIGNFYSRRIFEMGTASVGDTATASATKTEKEKEKETATAPTLMVFRLRRFDGPKKNHRRFTFGDVLDMSPYCDRRRRRRAANKENEKETEKKKLHIHFRRSCCSVKDEGGEGVKLKDYEGDDRGNDEGDDDDMLYRLVGCVVHKGNSSGGRYFAYAKERGKSSRWIRFWGVNVRYASEAEIRANCFGGSTDDDSEEEEEKRKVADDDDDSKTTKRSVEPTSTNAYLLFYENGHT